MASQSMTAATLKGLVDRMRMGDEGAAREFVRLIEPQLRSAIRVRLLGNRLRRLFDSIDISQSVFKVFFGSVIDDPSLLDNPAHLERLLLSMAGNKLASHARRHMCQKRDLRRDLPLDKAQSFLASIAEPSSPEQQMMCRESLKSIRNWLSISEYELLTLRCSGLAWDEIAEKSSLSPEAARKRAVRAIDRVRGRLHAPASSHG